MRKFTLVIAAAVGLAGCAYKSSYNRTNFDVDPKPVQASSVKVVRSADDLVSQYSELGRYKGRAPTLTEAMDQAKIWCGNAGGDVYILYQDPYQGSFGRYNIDGTCGLIDPSTTPEEFRDAPKKKKKAGAKKKKQAQ